jgi:hypothetical protein
MDVSTTSGGRTTATSFRFLWLTDFEYGLDANGLPQPKCMVAREYHSGRVIRLEHEELLRCEAAPFDIGSSSALVAYMAAAEISCFLSLGWPLPKNIIDLYCEHRVETNGIFLPSGNGLLSALAIRGQAHIDASEKNAMRELAMREGALSEAESCALMGYCESDVDALKLLLDCMTIDWPRALYRGRYMSAVAQMERTGIPIDTGVYEALEGSWDRLKTDLVRSVDVAYGIYDGTSFRRDRFTTWLKQKGIDWPRLATGQLALDDDTFKFMEGLHPVVGPLRELRQTLSVLRRPLIAVGPDGRSRTSLFPFKSKTGRNQPPSSRFAFGPAKWLRGIIKPAEGKSLAYIDFSSQEIGVAAGLSGDERLIEAYQQADPYIAFAIQVGLVPPGATKTSHPEIRERCKALVLGVNYGMGAWGVASRTGISVSEATYLLDAHRQAYRKFWRWSDSVVSSASLYGTQSTVFGWERKITAEDRATSLMNFPMQANGAEVMRIAAIAACEAGIAVCAPIHDAFLIEADSCEIDSAVEQMRALMAEAGAAVTGGLPLRTDARVIRYPDRYMEDRGIAMWNRVMSLVGQPEAFHSLSHPRERSVA